MQHSDTPRNYGFVRSRRFLPVFLAQFLGAMNDNMLRSGLVVMIAYAAHHGIPLPMENAKVLVTLCSALLVMPFILFSFLAGQLADKCEKARLITYTKVAEVAIMLVAAYGFATHNVVLLMVMLFISGTHSTFFGPVKYSILPEQLKGEELLAGNGFVSGGTFLGLLLGMISGGLLVVLEGNVIGFALVAVAVGGLVAALCIPRKEAAAPHTRINWHIVHGTLDMVRQARRYPRAFRAILGLAWFMLVGSVFMAQFANYASMVVGGNNQVYTLFLALFSVGIALGSVLCDRLLKGEVSARHSPRALLGVTLFTTLMVVFTPDSAPDELQTLMVFVQQWAHWPLMLSMLCVAMCGGIFMVPLYALLQTESEHDSRSRVIAASNMFDSLFMTTASIISAGLLALGVTIPQLFLLVAVLNLGVFLRAKALLRK